MEEACKTASEASGQSLLMDWRRQSEETVKLMDEDRDAAVSSSPQHMRAIENRCWPALQM